MTYTQYTVGLDLGSQHDFTAVAVLRHQRKGDDTLYHLIHLDRWRGPYTATVDKVAKLMKEIVERPAVSPARAELVVDETGVGGPVISMLKRAGLRPVGITITAGRDVTGNPAHGFGVPKIDLISALAVALETRRLRVRPDLRNSDTFWSEVRGYRREETESGHVRFGNDAGPGMWQEAQHDDMVVAAALALWRAETGPKPNDPAMLKKLNPW